MATTASAAVQMPVTRRRKMSYDEYLEFAGDAQIIEWTNGEAIIYMPPTDKHQDISRFLSTLIDMFVQIFNLGMLRYAPFEVKLWPDGPSREPDLIFVRRENLIKLTPERFEGGPDLVIEIISPGSVSEDRVRKFAQYEQAAVQEYWIIDPRPHQQQADFYVLGEDDLFHAAPLAGAGRYRSTVIPDFWFSIDWLWREPLPNPQLALAEIMISIEDLPADVKSAYQALYEALIPKE
jgi:Uma2 family endonuclease